MTSVRAMNPSMPTERMSGPKLARSFLAVVLGALILAGCPADPEDPPRPDGTACESIADCNAGQTCGRLVACVDQRCEDAQSLEIACPARR